MFRRCDPHVFEESIRTDVIMRAHDDAGPLIAIRDVKTGNATLGPARVDQLRRQVGIGADVPVIELNVRRGVMIKATDPSSEEPSHGHA